VRTSVLLPLVSFAVFGWEQAGLSFRYESATSSLTLHEPVVVSVTFANHLDRPVELDLGLFREGNFVLTLKGPTGPPITVTPHAMSLGGISGATEIQMAPGSRFTEELLVSKWFDFPQPGKYRLGIAFKVKPQSVDIWRPENAEVTLNLRERDEGVLRRICEERLKDVRSGLAGPILKSATVLANMNDPIVVNYLREVIASGLGDTIAIQGLERLGSAEAVQVLDEVARSDRPQTAALAIAALGRLKNRQRR
jgi:hypothetical protein